MCRASDFLKFSHPELERARPALAAFSNYLRHFQGPEAWLDADLYRAFFRQALGYVHWREHRQSWTAELIASLQELEESSALACAWSEALDVSQMQIVELQRAQDLREILQRTFAKALREGAQLRLLELANNQFLALILSRTGDLLVHQLDSWTVVEGGGLEPLRLSLNLVYTPDLELAHDYLQQLEVAPSLVARFRLGENGYRGFLFRGATMTPIEQLDGGGLTTHPQLFFGLKRLEQHFIRRESDTYYQDLTRELSLQIEQLASFLGRNPQANGQIFSASRQILRRAELAIENIYREDQLLSLLTRDLKNQLHRLQSLPLSDQVELRP